MWNEISLADSPLDVFEPSDPVPGSALLILPEWGQHAHEEPRLTEELTRRRLRAIAPFGTTWWLDQIEPAFSGDIPPLELIRSHIIPWMTTRWGVEPPRIRLLGWGVGGQGVLQWVFRHPHEFPHLASIDPAIDFHELYGGDPVITDLFPNREAARQQTALLRLHPAGWPRRMLLLADQGGYWFESVDRLEMKLRSMGIPVDAIHYPTEKPTSISDRTAALRAALDHLGRESLELPLVSR